MTRCLQALRFIAGLAMLVGGVAVLAPLAADILASHDPTSSAATAGSCQALPQVTIGHAIPDPRVGGGLPPASTHPWPHEADASGLEDVPPPAAAGYQPPVPPSSLPPQPAMMARPAPPLGATYRSTLAIPPPPLLDAHGPPPLAPGWTNRDPRQAARQATSSMPAVPATYAVRDGDDLTSLAIRFYGHPAAAGALFAANHDRLATPDILPIGLLLRLPPPWAVTAGRAAAQSRAIEPGPGIDRRPTIVPTGSRAKPTATGQPWLDGGSVPLPAAGVSG